MTLRSRARLLARLSNARHGNSGQDLRDVQDSAAAGRVAEYPPTTPNALDDEFQGSSLNTGLWTWRNQGGATATVGNGRLALLGTTQAGIEWRIIEQTAPATPWTVTVKMGMLSTDVDFTSGGIILVDSVSGRLTRYGLMEDGGWKFGITNYTNVTTFSAHVFRYLTEMGILGPIYLRVTDNGTNLLFGYSPNGIDFITNTTVSRTSFLTNGADRIGLGNHAEGSAPTPTLVVDWFRVNWAP